MKKPPVVKDYMATSLLTLKADTSIYEAIELLLKYKVSGAPVVDESGKLIGVISERDCFQLIVKELDSEMLKDTVAGFMTKKVITIHSDVNIYYAAGVFIKNVYRRLPVVDDGKLVGQISRRDVLRAIRETIHPKR